MSTIEKSNQSQIGLESDVRGLDLFDIDDGFDDDWLDTGENFSIETKSNKPVDKNKKQVENREEINNLLTESQVSIKMEFSCSPERVLEPNTDYSLDNVVEICSMSDSEDEKTDGIKSLVKKALNTNGNDDIIQLDSSFEDEENSNLCNIMNDHTYTMHNMSKESSRASNNDEIIKEKSTIETQTENNEDNIEDNLDDNDDNDSCHSRSTVDEEEQRTYNSFFEDLLDEKQSKNNSEKFIKKLKVEPRSDVNITDRELFVQNVINVFAEEDEAEDILMLQTVNKEINTQKHTENENQVTNSKESEEIAVTNSSAVPIVEAPQIADKETSSLQSSCDNNNSPTKEVNREADVDVDMDVDVNVQNKSMTEVEKSSQQTSNDNGDSECTTSNNMSLPDNCSEPMEFSTFESRFEYLDNAIEQVESSCSTLPLLKEFTALINDMHNDCVSFATATNNIETIVNDYVLEKFKVFRNLTRRISTNFYVESAQQTDPKTSRKRLRKLNQENKEILLASSESSSESDSSNSSSSTTSDKSDNFPRNTKKAQKTNSDIDGNEDNYDNDHRSTSQLTLREKSTTPVDENVLLNNDKLETLSQCTTLNSEAVYDDGIVLSKYLRSDVFSLSSDKNNATSQPSTPNKHHQSSTSSSVSSSNSASTDEDTSTLKTNKLKKKTKKKSRRREDDKDDKDKEIERLINLDGLMKRHVNTPSLKQSDADKASTKSQTQKNKTDGVLEFLEKDLSLSSDDSLNENEEEVITEKQYLERRNEDVKNQLLDESSNDTAEEDESNDDFEAPLSNDSDADNRSRLVDKFLKAYTAEDSEEADNEDGGSIEEVPANKNETSTKPLDSELNKPIEIISEDEAAKTKIEKVENSSTISPANSDCELLNDSFNYRKRSQPKSLEKILNEAEKRKKLQKLDEDLISLSSESDCSDVEAVDVEPAENQKSRAIKAMLRPDQLHRETLKAQKNESDRLRRLDKRQTMLAKVLEEHPEMSTEEELILDYNEETKTFIKVHTGLVKLLKQHQRDGVRFMYESCYGGVDGVKKNHGSGCILAHCMGLGKTLQLITLMHTVMTYKELNTSKVLVLCPKSTVMNWGDEIIRWLMPLKTKKLKVYTFNDTSDIKEKLSIMREWSESTHQKAGCLLIGYEAFRTLVFYHKYKIRNNLDTKQVEKIRDMIDSYLLQPGADLVVCDEGHIIKNSKSAISLAVAEIKTPKRIVLTGTPIQNNLKEYYSMVNFIKPLFLGTEKEFANLYANPIKNGQHKDSSKRDIKVMKQRSFVLHKKLSKFVQRKEAELLMSFLPKKFEYVLFVPMTDVQNKLYECILESIQRREDHRGRGLITDYTCLRKIWTHPKVLEDAWKNATNMQFKRDARKQPNSDDDQPDDIYDSQSGFMSVKNDWWRSLIAASDLESILPSNKLRTMFEILRMCEENGEKCLIFSAFVAVLNVVEYFFQKLSKGDQETIKELNIPQGARLSWEANKDYFRLDGKTSKSTRHEMIKRFNQPLNTRARVFLISAKAGGQGINLIGANRVIILDTSWNPSNDQQNIFRVFRLGQKKNCYIYRLLAMGTMEEKVYSRSVTKQAMSFRVMDVQQIDRHYSMAELAELYTLTIPIFSERPTPIFPQDSILANLLRSYPDLVYKYHEHNSLLENKVEQELSEQEKIDAWAAYEQDLQTNSQLSQMTNVEDMHNRMSQGQMPNYTLPGSTAFPGFNMQSLINYRNMTPSVNAGYLNPMLNQYTNLNNQQYLEAINTFRQYGQTNGSAYNAMIANTFSMLAGMPPPTSAVGTAHNTSGGSITTNPVAPINALSELARYGLGMNSSAGSLLSSATGNVNSLYDSAGMTPAMFANAPASYYEKYQTALQHLNSGGSGVGLSPLNNLTNSAAFQTPRRTPPQTASRKSSTPDLTGYRNNAVGTGATTPTSMSAMATAGIPSNPNELPRFPNNPNFNPTNNINTSLTSDAPSTSTRKADTPVNSRATTKSTLPAPNVSTTHSVGTSRTGVTVSAPQNRTTTMPTTLSSTSKASHVTTSKAFTKATGKSTTTTTASLPTTMISSSTTKSTITTTAKTTDPQIRVRNMDQLYASGNRAPSLQGVATAKEISASNFSSKNKPSTTSNTSNITTSRNKQTLDNRLLSASTAAAAAATTAAAAELMKARSEMQIIPTTSPPGTASISKQLSEISPSISLTAVHTNTTQKASNNLIVHSALSKVSIANTTTVTSRTVSNNRMNTTTTTAANRQQIVSTGTQQRKSIAGTNNNNNNNISNNTIAYSRKTIAMPITSTVGTPSSITTTPSTNLHSKKVVSGPNQFSTAPNVISSNNTKTGQAAVVATVTNKAGTTITPTMPATITATTKSVSSVLRQHHIRKMPSPVPPLNLPSNNATTVSSLSPNIAKAVNAKTNYVIASTTTTLPPTANNAAQYFYNKNGTANKRSFSPTVPTTGPGSVAISAISRTAAPTNATTAAITHSRNQPLNNGIVASKSKAIKSLPSAAIVTLPTRPSTPTTTTAKPSSFPVNLQRSNTTLQVSRPFSKSTSVRIGNRTQSATSIVTPKITSVASLNTTSMPAATPGNLVPNPVATAARVAAFKKATGKVNPTPQISKQSQERRYATLASNTTTTSSAIKTAVATAVAQQRLNTAPGITRPQQQQLLQQQTSIQRVTTTANNGGSGVSSLNTSRLVAGGTQIGGLNVRPIVRGTISASSNVAVTKRATPPISSAAMTRLLNERKRKSSDIISKDVSIPSKRPKDP